VAGARRCGRTYDPPPFVVDGPDACSLVGCESVPWVGSPDSTFCRCGRISWSRRIYSKLCDAPPLVGTALYCFRVAVGCMQKWARGSKCFLPHPLDQTDITTVNPLHPKCVVEVVIARTRVVAGCRAGRTSRAGRTYWSGRTCLVWSGDSPFIPYAYMQVKIPTQLVELY
jgi:hypothetical protein